MARLRAVQFARDQLARVCVAALLAWWFVTAMHGAHRQRKLRR